MAENNNAHGASMYDHRLSDIAEEPKTMLLPIEGYEKMPLVTLEESMEPLVGILQDIGPYVYIAKYNSENPRGGLSVDQSAAVMLYTMGSSSDVKPLYHVLNSILRSDQPDRHEHLRPWFLYLKLFITALSRIPSYRGTVYRGVKLDLSDYYINNKKFVWWGFSSCTKSLNVLQSEIYLGRKGIGTIFIIECFSGKEIRQCSFYSKEDEVLLVAARQFIVVCRLNPAPHLWIIRVKEIEPPFPFLKTDGSISSNLEASSINNRNNSSDVNLCSQCSKTTSKSSTLDVETTTDDLAYNVKFDKDTMTYQDSILDDSTQIEVIEPILYNLGKNIGHSPESHSASSLPLINSSTSVMSNQNQQVLGNVSVPLPIPNSGDCNTAFEPVLQTKVMRFEHTTITVESAKILAENIRKNNRLEILYLVDNDLKDEGLFYIINAIADRSLLRLFVIDNKITDISARFIADLLLRTPEVMNIISLDKNFITVQGLRALIQATPRDTKLGLRALSVTGNLLIDDECIDVIINMLNEHRSIRSLYLEKCNLSEDGKKRLQRATSEMTNFSLKV